MSDWMSGPHKAQRTVPLEVASDPEPVELTDPVDVIAWLRALPVGAVLLDKDGDAWQLCKGLLPTAFQRIGGTYDYPVQYDEYMNRVARDAPFRVLWRPGGAT